MLNCSCRQYFHNNAILCEKDFCEVCKEENHFIIFEFYIGSGKSIGRCCRENDVTRDVKVTEKVINHNNNHENKEKTICVGV